LKQPDEIFLSEVENIEKFGIWRGNFLTPEVSDPTLAAKMIPR